MQLELNYQPTAKRLGNQQQQILTHLNEGKTLTVGEALSLYGIYALSQRIGELRRMGYQIESVPFKTESGAVVARYRRSV
jgi:hypothetical protein